MEPSNSSNNNSRMTINGNENVTDKTPLPSTVISIFSNRLGRTYNPNNRNDFIQLQQILEERNISFCFLR